MQKKRTCLTNPERFQKDPSKKYIRRFRFYPSFMYQYLDNWLSKMSRRGWHLVHSNMVSFLFEQDHPEEKLYFTYEADGFRNDSGQYSIPLRYPFLEKTYGITKKYSKLNKNESKAYLTIEIDTERIDTENDISYKELLSDRNRLYKRRAIRNAVVFGVLVLLVILFVYIN